MRASYAATLKSSPHLLTLHKGDGLTTSGTGKWNGEILAEVKLW